MNGVKQKLSFTIMISIEVITNRAILKVAYIFQKHIYHLTVLLGRTTAK